VTQSWSKACRSPPIELALPQSTVEPLRIWNCEDISWRLSFWVPSCEILFSTSSQFSLGFSFSFCRPSL